MDCLPYNGSDVWTFTSSSFNLNSGLPVSLLVGWVFGLSI